MDIKDKIKKIKQDRNAIILCHNYQLPELQEIADFVGDSLDLSRTAARVKEEVIVFCGVHFMAETAKILSPNKTVLIPEAASGCPMADMITAQELADLKQKKPGAVVVCYVNSTAEVKALSDICCTSGNALKIVNSIPQDKEIIFVPDQYLGAFVKEKTGRNIHLWPGYCPTHMRITAKKILQQKENHPDAAVIVHPECKPEATRLADAVLGTMAMCRYAKESTKRIFIIGTEIGMLYRLKKENPEKTFIPAAEDALCLNMKMNTLEKVLWSLEEMKTKVELSEKLMEKALKPVIRMIEDTPK